MRKYIVIILTAICAWLALPSALADRLVTQEPRFTHRRVVTEREFLPDYYADHEGRTYRATRVERRHDADNDDNDDDDNDARVIIRRPAYMERRVIIRERD